MRPLREPWAEIHGIDVESAYINPLHLGRKATRVCGAALITLASILSGIGLYYSHEAKLDFFEKSRELPELSYTVKQGDTLRGTLRKICEDLGLTSNKVNLCQDYIRQSNDIISLVKGNTIIIPDYREMRK